MRAKRLIMTVITLSLISVALSFIAGCGKAGNKESKVSPPAEPQVFVIQTAPANMLKQLEAKEIDAFVAWEPFNAEAVRKGTGKYLLTSGEVWKDHPCCVLAATGKVSDSVREALAWAHLKATRFINNPSNREKVLQYAMEFTGKDKDTVIDALKNIRFTEFPNSTQFKEYYLQLKQGQLLKKTYQDIGYQNESSFFTSFLADRYVKDAAAKLAENPSWKPSPVAADITLRLGFINQDLHELAAFVARKEGYYQEVGLQPGKNLILKGYPNGVAIMEAFKVNELDVSYLGGAPATLKRINDDVKIDIIAGANDEGSAIVVRADSDIQAVKDLFGKTVAVPGVGTVQYYLLDRAVRQAGGKLVIK